MLKELISRILNPQVKETPKLELKHEYMVKFNKSLYLKEYLKTKAWLEYEKPKIYDELETGMRRLIADGVSMSEVDIKAILSYMKAIKDRLDRIRYDIEIGEEAGLKLERMKT